VEQLPKVDGLRVMGIQGIPRVRAGDRIPNLLHEAMASTGISLVPGDILVVAQAVVSRSEGSVVELCQVSPSPQALGYAETTGKDPRLVEVVLGESRSVIWASEGFMICETRHGFVCANAGVDASNVDEGFVSTLPRDPDASARGISDGILSLTGLRVPVLISDSEGRPFRRGAIGVAVGVWGLEPVVSMRGVPDSFGRALETTEVAVADLVCSAAAIVMGEAAEGVPAAIVRGVKHSGEGRIKDLLHENDVFKNEMLRRRLNDHPDDRS
jgi:coenzyme F420-0:L-glutamate ligase/coenzyme F420-1:gamma-L-glutamate ligase